MADGSWRIDHSCPQCGAPVSLDEGDRVLACPYCRVRLYIVHSGPARRFLVPPRGGPEAGTIFVPYWRFKGAVFTCTEDGVRHGILDRTRCAVKLPGLPPSLGVRPQAMRLLPAAPDTPGLFLKTALPLEQAVATCCAATVRPDGLPIGAEAFIGETASLVYQPVRLADGIYDAVLDRRIAPLPAAEIAAPSQIEPKDRFAMRFLPTLCPECGMDLEAPADSLVLACTNCGIAWQAQSGRYERVRCVLLEEAARADLLVPFWRIDARVGGGITLETYGDLARLANLPRVARKDREWRAVRFWTPAFKLHPGRFLRLAAALTLAQPDATPGGDRIPPVPIHPVTLPAAEGTESLRILLAEMAAPKGAFLSRWDQITFEVRDAVLAYVPFRAAGGELMNGALAVCVNRKLLDYGRNI